MEDKNSYATQGYHTRVETREGKGLLDLVWRGGRSSGGKGEEGEREREREGGALSSSFDTPVATNGGLGTGDVDVDVDVERCFNVINKGVINVDDTIHYSDLTVNILGNSSLTVKTGKQCLKNSEPLFKITVVPGKDEGKFAIVVSMSRVIGDGFT